MKRVLLVGVVLAWAGSAVRADIYTQGSTFVRTAFGNGGTDFPATPGGLASVAVGAGAIYSNTITTTGIVPGVGFRSVGATRLTDLMPISGASNSNVTNSANTVAYGVFALQGQIDATGTAARLQSGGLNVYQIPANTFVTNDPSTWGTGGTPVAQFVLKAPENVRVGNPDVTIIERNAAQENLFSFTSPTSLQGFAIFKPGETNAQGQPDSPLFKDLTMLGLPPGSVIDGEALILDNLSENLQITSGGDIPANFQIDGTDVTQFNAIAALFGLSDLAGLGTAFATQFGGGTANSYTPGFTTSTADFPSQILGGVAVPGYQVQQAAAVPEPATLALLGLALGGAAGLRAVRRRRS